MRLIERKLDALTQILHATASSDTAEALLEKLVDALLDLFPQAEDVGVLVEDERTGELQRAVPAPPPARPRRDRRGTPGRSTAQPFGGELRVPGTIIQHVVSDRRGVLLGETSDEADEAVGTRMGAPLIYHGAHYGVVYVESQQQAFRQEDVDLLQAIATQAGLAIHATRVAAQLAAARSSSAICASRARSSAACCPRTCRRSSASTSPSTTSPPIRSAATSTTSSGTTRRTSGSPSATSPARRSAPRSTWRG